MVNLKYASSFNLTVGGEPGKKGFKIFAVWCPSLGGGNVWKVKLLLKFSTHWVIIWIHL